MEERICAYIDILGFKQIIKRIHDKNDPLEENFIERVFDSIKTTQNQHEHIFEMKSLKYSVFSDTIIISCKTKNNYIAGLKAIINSSSYLQAHLFKEHGILVRGAITHGNLKHDDIYLYGQPVVDAHNLEEKSAIYPRILIAKEISNKISLHQDPIFNSFLKESIDGFLYINPSITFPKIIDTPGILENEENNDYKQKEIRSLYKSYFKEQPDIIGVSSKWAWLKSHLFDEPL